MTTQTQEGYLAGSVLAGLAANAIERFRGWLATLWLGRVANAADTSTFVAALRELTCWARHSFLYRWLTTEPDPDVIVIDLRETLTVGPFIALLDRLAPVLERTWRGSLARRATERVRTAAVWTWVADARTAHLLAAALEPPELPDEKKR